jgi:type I restriction enzyme S subunit
MSSLPTGWLRVKLSDVCSVLSGYGFPERLQGRSAGDLPFYKVGDISGAWKRGESLLGVAAHYVTNDEAADIRARPLPAGATVFAKIGAAIGLNRRAMLSCASLVDNNVMALVPRTEVLCEKYLFHFACTLRLIDYAQATTVPSVRKSDIEEIAIPIASYGEQDRIVAEIEKQFTRLDAATAALKRVQANLKRYRASVLKAACEGRLVPTEAELARKEGRDYEPADQLLKRILRERRARWEADILAKMIASGKRPTDDRWKQKYKEPSAPDSTNLPNLPEGWCWTSLEQLTSLITSGSRGWGDRYSDSGPLFIRAQDIKTDSLNIRQTARVQLPTDTEGTRTRVQHLDLLVTITGANVTKTALVRDQIEEAYVSQRVGLVRSAMPEIAAYLFAWIVSPRQGRAELLRLAYGAGKPGLNLDNLRELGVALPPAAEQVRIQDELSRTVGSAMKLESSVYRAERHSLGLRASVLQSAFSGRLVSQDPTDEPASILLDRIRGDRTRTANGNKNAAKRRSREESLATTR